MHSSFPEVKNMSVNTFLKITRSYNSDFVNSLGSANGYPGDKIPYILDII
jgi:hypothetical protein